jgi:hypothetical protein
VTLDCVAEGPQRWDDLAQLILATVRADGARKESVTRSYRTLTGMTKAARAGRLLGSASPYGYVIEYETVQEPGKPPRVIPVRLVPDPRRAHVVRWLFATYAAGGWSLDDLARELNARGAEAPPPGRKGGRPTKAAPAMSKRPRYARVRGEACTRWTHNGVRTILRNPRYTGALTWNRRSRGKYHRLENGQAVAGRGDEQFNPSEEWEVVPESHEPLVSQELFDLVQERLLANRHAAPSIGAYLFSGLLTCSHCGRTLAAVRQRGKARYRCHKYGSAGEVVCGFQSVPEAWVFDKVVTALEEEVLAPGRLEALRAEVRRQDEEERAPEAVDPLRKRLADLEAQIERGNQNLALLPADRLPGVIAAVRGWEKERDDLKAELERRRGGGRLEGLDEAVAACEGLLWRLREARQAGDDLLLRQVLREAISRVELRWEWRPYGKKARSVPVGGVIHLRPQLSYPALSGKP